MKMSLNLVFKFCIATYIFLSLMTKTLQKSCNLYIPLKWPVREVVLDIIRNFHLKNVRCTSNVYQNQLIS